MPLHVAVHESAFGVKADIKIVTSIYEVTGLHEMTRESAEYFYFFTYDALRGTTEWNRR